MSYCFIEVLESGKTSGDEYTFTFQISFSQEIAERQLRALGALVSRQQVRVKSREATSDYLILEASCISGSQKIQMGNGLTMRSVFDSLANSWM